MKSSQITLVVIGFILLALMATNPSIEDHRQAVVEEMKKKMSNSSDGENKWEQLGNTIGMALSQEIVEKAVTRKNYLLFSLTKVTFGDKSKNIGFGLFGKVFVSNNDDFDRNSYVDTAAVAPAADTTVDLNQDDGSITYAQTINIGTQVWMTKNLDVSTFRNGDQIPQASTSEEWYRAVANKQPTWCYYENAPANGAKYGKLYNWYAVNDPRGLAPVGYHIPTDEEWTILTDYLGGEEKAGAKMKSKNGWYDNGNGTNSSGFSGVPGGFRNFTGSFHAIGENGNWWSSTEYDTVFAWLRYLGSGSGVVGRAKFSKLDGSSVRCLRD